jgi:2'-5' RNA ligase
MLPLAFVRVGEDEANDAIWFSGIEAPWVDDRGRALLARQKISGDWRDVAGGMELSEVLVLNRRDPGFPLPRATMRNGKARALTAAGVIRQPMASQQVTIPDEPDTDSRLSGAGLLTIPEGLDYTRLGVAVADALMAAAKPGATLEDVIEQTKENVLEEAAEAEAGDDDVDYDDLVEEEDGEVEVETDDEDEVDGRRAVVAASAEGGHTGAMLALRMTDEDAARLCVHDGLPMDELHSTLAYLGEADKITPEVRERMVKDVTKLANKMQPFQAEAADVTVFNPGTNNDREPALVLGLTGQELADLHGNVSKMSWDGFEMPEQFAPYKPHVTLRQPAGDLERVGAVADRMGPVTFDRLRLAFAGEVTDIPLGGVTTVGQGYDIAGAESMMAVDHTLRARAALARLDLAGVPIFEEE